MPIYEYRCGSCGFENEYLQKVSDAPMKTCPKCGEDALNKLISAAGFKLKGTGWYATDFKGGNASKAQSESKEKGDGKEASTTKEVKSESTDSKPDSGGGRCCGGGCSCS